MAFADLCELQDIKNEYPDIPTSMNSRIKNKIPDFTREVYNDSNTTETPSDEDTLYYMKMACIYKALVWLEQVGKIQPLGGNIQSMNDGDFSVTFANQGGVNQSTPKTNLEWYGYYMRKLKPLPPIGSNPNY